LHKLPMLALMLAATGAGAQSDVRHAHGGTAASSPAAHAAAAPSAGDHLHGAGRSWTRYPLLLPAMGGEGERASARLRTAGIDAGELVVYGGDTAQPPLRVPVQDGAATFAPQTPQAGNYHWVIARSESNDGGQRDIRVASTVWYFSNPGPAPTAMLQAPKHELEIVPEPLPREHNSYRESDKAIFLVRFKGAPAANQPVVLETEAGSRENLVADGEGRVVALLPRDFKPIAASDGMAAGGHRHGPARAKFVLAAERQDGSTHYLTALNLSYGADADRERNLGYGAAFAALGMVMALPLLRRRAAEKPAGDEHV
jgi:hypothetical protein